MKYSVVIPAYNEEKIIENTVKKVHDFLKKTGKSFEIIIADDGSVDNTLGVVRKIKRKGVRVVGHSKNVGRGSILSKAFAEAKGDIRVYIDADLAIDLNLFPRLMSAMDEGADIAIGSKHVRGAVVQYPFLRRVASKGYAFLARLILGSRVRDFQCGFKAFRADVLKRILPFIHEKQWSWDTEIIVKSEWAGFRVRELPARVVNIYKRESKVRLLKDIQRMGLGLVRIKGDKRNFLRVWYAHAG